MKIGLSVHSAKCYGSNNDGRRKTSSVATAVNQYYSVSVTVILEKGCSTLVGAAVLLLTFILHCPLNHCYL